MAKKKIKLEIDHDLNDDWIKKVANGYFQARDLLAHDIAQWMYERQQRKSKQQPARNE